MLCQETSVEVGGWDKVMTEAKSERPALSAGGGIRV